MKYLYIDNYRGFSNTFIPIKDVNFFVGENSTGKSSILTLINLLGTPEFWFNQEFNTDKIELGAFKDIVSMNSKSDKYFRIGVIECSDNVEFPTDRQHTFLFTFNERKGVPKIRDYSFVKHNKSIRIVFARKTVRFKISEIKPHEDISSTLLRVFNGWLEQNAGSERGYKIFSPKDESLRTEIPFIYVKGILQQLALEGQEEQFDIGKFLEPDMPTFSHHLAWIAPVRTKPARIYGGLKSAFSPEGEHTPHLIKSLLSRERTAMNFTEYAKKFGMESRLFEGLYTKNFGRNYSSPFEIRVEINRKRLRISDVGYGVSQSLPIIVELFARPHGCWFALQQPEVHLHPRAQASLGDLIMNLAIHDGKRFFVETHSDYTIDRFRVSYRDNDKTKKISSQVLFFERDERGNKVHSVSISTDGNYSEEQPESFREFFIDEEIRVLGV